MTTRLHPFRQILVSGLLFTLLLVACRPDREPTAAPTWMPPLPSATAEAVASASPATAQPPSVTATALQSSTAPASPSATPFPLPTDTQPLATVAPAPTSTPPRPALAIDLFAVDVEEIGATRRLSFNWETSGANRVRLLDGTEQRATPWEVPSDGTLIVVLPSTKYRDPPMTLMAQYESDDPTIAQVVSRTITIEWECQYAYFFAPVPAACPVDEAVSTWAAEQVFENGRMLWLQEIRSGGFTSEDLLFVLFDDGRWQWYPDTWTSDQPESDPSIIPPQGRVQPQRGFGKVWREHAEVRERIGWGLALEQGYYAEWQEPIREFVPGAAYIRTFADGVIQMSGWRDGTWQFAAP